MAHPRVRPGEPCEHDFMAEFDDEGVFFYQAFNDAIADWAIAHGRLGGFG